LIKFNKFDIDRFVNRCIVMPRYVE